MKLNLALTTLFTLLSSISAAPADAGVPTAPSLDASNVATTAAFCDV